MFRNYGNWIGNGGTSSIKLTNDMSSTEALEVFFDAQRGDGLICYVYTVKAVGTTRLRAMIDLAKAGRGLNSYIHRNRLKGKIKN